MRGTSMSNTNGFVSHMEETTRSAYFGFETRAGAIRR